MPEAPEVRTITDQLELALKGHVLQSVEVLSGRYARHGDPPGLSSFRTWLPLPCDIVNCKGKLIFFSFGGRHVLNTLGMTGFWSRRPEDHARLRFTFDVGDFYFCDARNFGTMHFDLSQAQLLKKLGGLGHDLLNGGRLPDDMFRERLMRRKKKTIVETLMDQSVLAGVGNYIKCEALYRSGISPHRVTGTLSNDEFKGLQDAVVHVMTSSYASKGHTMSDFRDIDGNPGTYKFDLAVYRKDRDPLGNEVIREETKDGRTTHWVPSCQR